MDDYLDEILAENDFHLEILASLDDYVEPDNHVLVDLISAHQLSSEMMN